MSRSKWLALLLLGNLGLAQETLYMAVLSSRLHRLNASDNPIVGAFVSTDGGATWQHKGWEEYIRTFYVEAGSDGTIWSACGNGVLRSTDGGDRWRITTGWEITEVLKIKADPNNASAAYAATAYGLFKTTDRGETWKQQRIQLPLPFTSDVLVDRSESKHILVATEEGVFRSADAGSSWSPAGLKGKGIRTIVQDPADPKVFWVGTEEDGVYRSSDGGSKWVSMNNGLKHMTVYVIALDPRNSARVYAGTHDGGVYVSTNGGVLWEQRNSGLKNLVVHSFAILKSNPNVVFAGTLNGGLYRSIDAAATWQYNSQEEGQIWGLSVR